MTRDIVQQRGVEIRQRQRVRPSEAFDDAGVAVFVARVVEYFRQAVRVYEEHGARRYRRDTAFAIG